MCSWLNFANGAIGYDELMDTDGDGVADTPFYVAMAGAEAVRLDPLATGAAHLTFAWAVRCEVRGSFVCSGVGCSEG
ncbi:MAG TPA: hypothetical protein VD902_03425 [Symbiobacteriaceae bacterium]|nr:hypothetical protein [Symbiobacteriaceae bacterium]